MLSATQFILSLICFVALTDYIHASDFNVTEPFMQYFEELSCFILHVDTVEDGLGAYHLIHTLWLLRLPLQLSSRTFLRLFPAIFPTDVTVGDGGICDAKPTSVFYNIE